MKKILTLMLVILSTGIFAADWYTSKQKVTDLKPQLAQKDTAWYGYAPDVAYLWGPTEERATFFNVNDFGLEYPVNLHALTAYLYEGGYTYHYKIYDADGTTLLYETPDSISTDNNYDYFYFDTPLVLKDDFWMAAVPNSAGMPTSVSSSELTSTNSYIGNGTDGWNIMYDGTDYFEFENVVALSPYQGTDIHPPLDRKLMGTENFQDYNADVTLIVEDQSAITTVSGEYSTDGGTTWTNFSMNDGGMIKDGEKSTYMWTGTIPGQVDGTVAQVIFFMGDELGNEGWSDTYEASWSKDLPLLSESFEDEFPPPGWQLNTTGAGFVKATVAEGAFVKTGQAALTHWDDSGAQDDWAISPMVTLPADNSCTFMFWETGKWTNYYNYHEVAISTDGGVSWTNLAADSTATYADGEWVNQAFSLGTYAGQDVWFGFHYTGDYSDQWFIDDVEVIYDYEGPELVSLMANEALAPDVGAYLNNDMVLDAVVYDLSGVQSVTGWYTFDGGTTYDELNFTKAKAGNENWTATIPAMATAATGSIMFDLVDVGGLTTSTGETPIYFVEDTDPPVIKHVKNTLAFLGEPMNLEVVFEDESAITSMRGYYTKNQTSWFAFDLVPAKIHEYTYLGTLPAETSEVFDNGFVRFEIQDAAGNILNSDQYQVQWLDGQTEIFEDFESGAGNWSLTGNWAIVEEGEYTSATHALTESPGGNYAADENTTANWATYMDWTSYKGANIMFWTKYDIEAGFDYMYFQGTGDGGMTWITLGSWDAEGVDWHEERISMSAFAGMDQVGFRFKFVSDGGYEVNGMYIDDITLNTYNVDYFPPTIVYEAPPFYEGALENFTDAAKVTDISGVQGMRVDYSIDGIAQDPVFATNDGTDNMWTFTLANAPGDAGSQIDYMFTAADNSPKQNMATTDYFNIISGNHRIYDAGIVSYYMTAENNAAWAEKITVDTDLTQAADLNYALIRNYADGSGHISDDMVFHVWEDDAGMPGAELITPFDVTPEATPTKTSPMTRIDLRSKGLRFAGDFWIGVSSPYGIVYSTMESTDETGTTAYERSYTGTDDGAGGWTWSLNALDNWHFRAVLGEVTGIEDEHIPAVTSLEQNYPNPFNPATTINFSLADAGKVSLVVYDVMGREVAKLVDGEMSKGNHKISFDASNLVSGVYYYNLKAGDVNQTMKMMLIK